MARTVAALRTARVEDAPMLAQLWADALRRTDHHDQVLDLEQVIARASATGTTRILVAECDGEPAGALLMQTSSISPINPERAVHLLGPQVFPAFRRRGVARLLMESAVAYADESGIGYVRAAVGSGAGARDANRFLARLSFAPQATFRLAPVAGIRGRLQAQRQHLATTPRASTQVSRVLAARRSMRRSQSPTS